MLWFPRSNNRVLFARMENFPRISSKDTYKFSELGDLLRELESAKSEGYLPGLSYLDTARGVTPTVAKLPYSLQERWLAHGSQYKEQYNVCFPPFAFFTVCICNEAHGRNDPSFIFSTLHTVSTNSSHRFSTYALKLERLERRSEYVKNQVSAHKTELTLQRLESQSGSLDSRSSDIGRQCPILKKKTKKKHCFEKMQSNMLFY